MAAKKRKSRTRGYLVQPGQAQSKWVKVNQTDVARRGVQQSVCKYFTMNDLYHKPAEPAQSLSKSVTAIARLSQPLKDDFVGTPKSCSCVTETETERKNALVFPHTSAYFRILPRFQGTGLGREAAGVFLALPEDFVGTPKSTGGTLVPPKANMIQLNNILPCLRARFILEMIFARAHGVWTYEPREGRNAATAVCSTSAVVSLAF